jgi:hypothetical protein
VGCEQRGCAVREAEGGAREKWARRGASKGVRGAQRGNEQEGHGIGEISIFFQCLFCTVYTNAFFSCFS